MEDAEIIRQIKKGNVENIEILVQRYQEKALRVAFLITQNQFDAEDVVQETFVKIFLHIKQYDENRPFRPYLYRSVMNTALNTIKREDKKLLFEDVSEYSIGEFSAKLNKYDAILDQDDQVEELRRALEKLSPRERMVIVQRYYLGMSEREMSEEMKLAPGTIKWWLNSARRRLAILIHLERRE
jgi:RNA polymerase sigma-70 factor (ECF subfamily)